MGYSLRREDVLAWRDCKWGWDCILSLAGDIDQSRYWFPFTSARAFRLEGSISNTARFASCIPPPDQPSPNQHFLWGFRGCHTPVAVSPPRKNTPLNNNRHTTQHQSKKKMSRWNGKNVRCRSPTETYPIVYVAVAKRIGVPL